MLQDLRYAWRSLCATPRLTLTAVACAALGLGAAIFMTALVHAVLFAAPAIPDADRLVRVWSTSTATKETTDVSYADVLDLRARVRSFDAVESASRTRLAHLTDAGTERLRGEAVTPGYFALIGVRPAIGRLFTDAEQTARAAERPVLIGHGLWQRRYAGRADIVGQPFRTRPTSRAAAGAVRTIVGVMPAGFVGTVDPDVSEFWLPAAHYEPASQLADRRVRATWVLARLRPDTSLPAARADVQSLAASLAAEYPAAFDRLTLDAAPFGESWRERFRLSLYTLLAAASLLLLIACSNVATLLLARLAQRENELRVRLALGAPPSRIVRQLLVESGIIAAAGGGLALAAAAAAVRGVAASGLFELPPYVDVAIDLRSTAAGLLLVALTGVLFGVLPARLGSSASATDVGRSHGRISQGRRERRQGRVLVAVQVAFTFLLLVGSTLLFRTHQNLTGGDLGFRTRGLLRMALTPDPGAFPNQASRLALAGEIKRALEAYPGAGPTAVMAGVLPPWFDETVDIAAAVDTPFRDVGRHVVGPDFFGVMGIALRRGRGFEASDRTAGATTAIVSESLARRLAAVHGRDALGLRIQSSPAEASAAETFEIVGIVNDVRYHGPLRPRPADLDIYVPLERGVAGPLSIAIRTRVDPETLIEPLSRELGRLAPSSPQHWISTMEGELGLQYRDARLYASLSGVYGAAAATLALLGIYSVLANDVARRHREIGIRMAIGARPSAILRLVLTEGAVTLAAGLALGIGLATATIRVLTTLLYGVAASDVTTFTIVGAGLLVAGLAAALLPSLRAARVDPLEALRRA